MHLVSSIVFAAVALWTASVPACAALSATSPARKVVDVAQGEIVELNVSASDLTSVTGRLGAETVYFYQTRRDNFEALVGVDLEAKPGLANVFIRGETIAGQPLDREIVLRVKRKAFRKESFTVAPKFDRFSPQVLERIAFERERMAAVYRNGEPHRLWDGAFRAPVPTQVTSPFGYRRIINGAARSPHTGVDLKAAIGREIAAPNHGRVVLLGDFFFSGKSLVVDHGAGLFTMYFHLSEFNIEEGGEVRRGEIIGLAGMSGRVTGPHLHWGARLNGARIDPFELIEKVGADATASAQLDAGQPRMENDDGKKAPNE